MIYLFLFAQLLIGKAAWADDDFSMEVEMSTQLASSIYMIEGAGGNVTALIGKDGTLLVDDDFAPMAGKLIAKLKELGGDRPRFIINTHFHYDHTGGNEVFGASGTIIAASRVRERLMQEEVLWKKSHPPIPTQGLPHITFGGSMSLHLNGDHVRVVHLPNGHTDGDTVVFFESGKVVSMGDLYFSGMFPVFHPEHDGSIDGYVKNIEWVLKESAPGAKIVPGHGPLSSRDELERYHRMIKASVAVVKRGIRERKTLAQIQKTGLPREWESFSHGYRSTDQWLESIYNVLKH